LNGERNSPRVDIKRCDMTKLSCSGCGQRYYGLPSQATRCDFCNGLLEDTGWHAHGWRAAMMPIPVVQPPLPAYLESGGGSQSTNRSGIGSAALVPYE
jgi:hypothetical protein